MEKEKNAKRNGLPTLYVETNDGGIIHFNVRDEDLFSEDFLRELEAQRKLRMMAVEGKTPPDRVLFVLGYFAFLAIVVSALLWACLSSGR